MSQQSLENNEVNVNNHQQNPVPSAENDAQEQAVTADAEQHENNEEQPTDGEHQDAKKELTEAEKREYATQRRIDAMNRKLKEALEQKQHYEEQVKAFQQQNQPKELVKPVLDDFDTAEDYEKAMETYIADSVSKKQQEEARKREEMQLQKEQERRLHEQQKSFQEKLEPFKKSAPDFDAVYKQLDDFIGDLTQTPSTNQQTMQVAASFVLESPKTAELIYHLGKNPQEVDEIARLAPYAASKKLVELEAALSNKPKQKPNDLPEPAKTSGGKANAGHKSVADMSHDELARRYR